MQIVMYLGGGLERMLILSLSLLAPFAIIGFFYSVNYLKMIFNEFDNLKSFFNRLNMTSVFQLIAACFAVYFILNSGLLFELSKDPNPLSYAVNNSISPGLFLDSEHSGAIWIKKFKSSDYVGVQYNLDSPLLNSIGLTKNIFFEAKSSTMPHHTIIFLGKSATYQNGLLSGYGILYNKKFESMEKTKFYKTTLSRSNKIFSNFGSSVYYYN